MKSKLTRMQRVEQIMAMKYITDLRKVELIEDALK